MIDKRISYYIVVDTETANGLDDPFVYDCGWVVTDKRGKVYETASYINKQIFCEERALMDTAYYAQKIPRYVQDIKEGKRTMATFYEIKYAFRQACEKWGVKAIIAHNARFDNGALNKTQRWLTKSKYRYFYPYGIPLWDTMKMAQDVVKKKPTYLDFCILNGYVYGKNNTPRVTAEALYKYIAKDSTFEEAHTALEDALIEKDIFVYCMRQHKHMRKNLWED